jgi:hypothetical protein
VNEYGSLPLLAVQGNLTGVFDSFTGVSQDGLGFTEYVGPFSSVNDLAVNQWFLQYAQNVVNPVGFAAGTYDMVYFHYRVAGYVPEPGTMGLMALGGLLLRSLRKRTTSTAA